MVKEIITHSEQETLNIGIELGRSAEKGAVYALYGELGAGKTIIAKGIAKGIGIKEEITSPTFIMLEIYKNTLPMYHFDLYRINNSEELDELGFDEYWEDDGISVIEWAEKAFGRISESAIRINIRWINSTDRRIIIEYPFY
jgi:tRNA threonylcarbamoyladenosine biosynthesis protein TsaE